MRNSFRKSQQSTWMIAVITIYRGLHERLGASGRKLKPTHKWLAGGVLCALLLGGLSLVHFTRRSIARQERKSPLIVNAASAQDPKPTPTAPDQKSDKKASAPARLSASHPKKSTNPVSPAEKEQTANNTNPAIPEKKEVPSTPRLLQKIVSAPPVTLEAKENAEKEDPDISRKRQSWFFDQRAYPNKHIPPGAFQKALEQRDTMKAQQRASSASKAKAEGIITFPGDALWHLMGPQPVSNPFGQNGGFPTVSGRVNAIAIDPTTPATIYIGGAAGGVWKTTDGGTTWAALTDTQPSLAVGSITIDPNSCSTAPCTTIYVGTGEENFNQDAFYGAGILKSTNGGTTWTQLGASTFAQALGPQTGGAYIGQIAVQPGNASIILAAVSYVADGTVGGIYRSTDGGMTWTEDAAPRGLGATSVFFESTSNPGTTATAWMAMGDPFPVITADGEAANGIYKSTDSGQTWTLQTGGLPTVNLGRITLGYAPMTSGGTATIYAAIADSSTGSSNLLSLWKTTTGGTGTPGWSQITSATVTGANGFCNSQCFYDMAIGVDPANASVVVLGGGPGPDNFTSLFESQDGGTSWTPASAAAGDFAFGSTSTHVHVDTHAIAFTPSGSILYVGDDGGMWSTNTPTPAAGVSPTWTDLNAGLAITQFYPGLTAAVSDENYGFGGTQDNDSELFSGTLTWQNDFICGDGGFTAVDQTTPTNIWAACNVTAPVKIKKAVYNGQFVVTTSLGTLPGFSDAETAISASGDAMQFIPPIALDDSNQNNLYFGTCRVWMTNNAASSLADSFIPLTPSWTTVSGDLTNGNAAITTNCTGANGSIANLEVAHSNSSVIVAGTTNGKVWETTTGGVGNFWTDIDAGSLPNRSVTAVRTKRGDSTGAIVYVTFSGFDCGGTCNGTTTAGHVFKTTTAGTTNTWTNITGDLPDIPVNDIIVDHQGNPTHDALYIATDVGVFSCPNPEAATPCQNWTVLGDGLPNSPVLGLAMRRNSRILRAATHGRSVWDIQLTDVNPPALASISSVTPAAVNAGAGTTAITITGVNFSSNTQVQFLGTTTGVTTTFINTTQLNVSLSSTLLKVGGVFPITLLDSQGVDSGSALGTGGAPFAVLNPLLDPLTMSPTTALTYTAVPFQFTATAAEPFLQNSVLAFYDTSNPPVLQFQLPLTTVPMVTSGGTVYNLTTAVTQFTTPFTYQVVPYNPAPGGDIDPIAIHSGPPFNLTGPVPFTFTVTANPNPLAIVSPNPIFLSTAPNTTSTVLTVSITNFGGAALNITAQSITGANAVNFSFAPPAFGTSCNFPASGQSGTGTITLTAGGGTCNFGMTYTAATPPGNANSLATLMLTDNGSGNPQAIPITGVPLTAGASGVLLLPVNFGAVAIGATSATMNTTLFNAGTSAVMVTSPGFAIPASANSADFQIVPFVSNGDGFSACPAVPFSLASLTACDTSLNFTPSIAGPESATITVTDNATGSPQSAALTGIGIEITSISPSIVSTGGPAFTLIVNGGGFASSAVVNVNGSPRLTTFINSTQLQASLPASDIASAGSLGITVTSPSPGGTTSEPKTLIVAQATAANNDNINFAKTPNFGTTTLQTATGTFTGGTSAVTLTWNSPFPDTNYTALCTAETTSGDFLLPTITLRTPTSISVVPTDGGTPSGTVACIALPDSDTSDIRHGRTVYSGSPATVTVNWNTAFPDTTYVAVCTVETQGPTVGGFTGVISSLTTTSVVMDNGAYATGTMHCIGVPVTDRSAVRHSKTTISGSPATVSVAWNTSFANTTAAGGNYAAVCSDFQSGVTSSGSALAISAGSLMDTGLTVINEIPSGTLHCLAVPLGDSAGIHFTEDTTQATAQLAASSASPLTPPDPTPSCAPGTAALQGRAKSVWWNYVAPANGTLIADTRFSSYTTVLSAWTLSTALPSTTETFTQAGCDSGNLPAAGVFPAASLMSLNVTAGTTYFIMVSDASAGGAGGTLTIKMDFASTDPANDDNKTPLIIPSAPFSSTENTIPATANTNGHTDPTLPAGCATGAASNGQSNSVWYSFTPTANGTIVADTLTSSYETILNVTSGSPTGTQMACNQSAGSSSGIAQSQVSFLATSGTTYYFMVSAFLGDGGTTNFHLTFSPSAGSAPTVTLINPASGPAPGGTAVTVTGTNFTGATAVKFGTTAATTFTVNSATQITATSPAGAVGTVDVTVTTPGGTSPTSAADQFTYVAAPTVTLINPASGPAAGGTAVTITGTNFTGATAVKFGTTAATTFTVNSAMQITATSPAGSGTVDVTATTPGGTSVTSAADKFTYTGAPTVTLINPTSGPAAGGTAVTITGTNFTGATAVKFGTTAATTFTVNSATQITATSPAGTAGTVDITVTTPGGTSATSAADQFTYVAAPTVTSINPTGGPAAGGTAVTITGTNFTGTTAVKFGTTAATTFTVNSATQITATSPAGTAGTVDITVTTPGGTSATSAADKFTYAGTPTVTSINPANGPAAGGTSVTVTGTNFTGATAVKFGAMAATTFTVNSATQITATSPAGSGTVDVTVTAIGGTSATSAADQFTYFATPTVTLISPTSGPAAGGTAVTVTGTNFTGATAVKFGTTAATTFTVNSATQITATSPAGSGTVDITVTTPGGTSATSAADKFTYTGAPTVTSINPASGPAAGGTAVTITGTNFTGATAVKFGTTAATTFTVNSATQITATSPAGTAGTVDVTVTTPGGTSATSAADQFTYVAVPTVTLVNPASGPAAGGTAVTITGTNFTGATAVKFGTTAATTFTVNSATQITVTSPAGAVGTVDVTVTTPGGTSATSAADKFTYTGAPTVTLINPTSGPAAGGTAVTITGTNFTGATAVKFGTTAATTFTVNSATQITATSPTGTAGTVDITVTAPGGTSATSAADQFTYVATPTVTLINPTSGPAAGGTAVTITGTNFTGATAVKFGTTAATTFTVNSATQITATSPVGAGTVDVTVTTAGGTSATSAADQFTYVGGPTKVVFSIQPTNVVAGASITPAIQVTLEDASGNTVTTATNAVTIGIGANPGSGTLSGTLTRNATAGVATFPGLSINKAGTGYTLTASAGAPITGATSTAFNVAIGTASSIVTSAGTPQSVAINLPFTANLQASVTDGFGNGVSGVQVMFAINPAANGASGAFTGANTATTNAQGMATANTFTANGTAGTYTVVASATGIPGTATFTLTNLAGAAASITATSGTPQTVLVNTAFSTLKALVKDAGGNPISGATVTFTAPTNGASGIFTGATNVGPAITDATGTASAPTFTANFTNGAYVVNATVAGVATGAPFSLTNNANAPTLTSLSPTSATVGGLSFPLTVNGTNFTTTSVVSFNGAQKATTFVSGTQLTATILAADIATAASVNVSVTTPAPGGGPSGSLPFAITNPAPTITSLLPTSATAGTAGFSLVVNGTNFVATSQVSFNGGLKPTTFSSSTKLTATISAGDIANAGIVPVTVINPAPGGGTSAATQFTINNTQPTLVGLVPMTTLAGSAAFTLTINGSGFVMGATATFNSTPKTVTFINSTQLTVPITAADVLTAGTFNVIVTNPPPSVGPSLAKTFTVNNPVPTLTTLGQTHIAGGAAFTLTVNGTNFNSSSVVNFGTKSETTTLVSATQVTAAIPAADVSTAGPVMVTVVNPAPGGGPTPTSDTFTVDGYTIAGPGTAVTIKAGVTAVIPITITPSANGFANPVVFSVTGLPKDATLMPLTVTPGATKSTVNLMIATVARSSAPPSTPMDQPLPPTVRFLLVSWLVALIGGIYFAIQIRRTPRPRRYAVLVPLALLLISGGVLAGCSSMMKGTPPGTSQLTVTATSGTFAQSTPAGSVTLTVQ